MKQTLSFHSPIIASTQSKVDVEAFEKSTDAFEKGEHLQSFYLLLDYIDPELRSKFGNAEGTEFAVPHGSIMVYLKLEGDQLNITGSVFVAAGKGKDTFAAAGGSFESDRTDISMYLFAE
ncbi:hypothetical protein NXV33_01470 [Bacteroides thetaiotaomicron]|nr:hypothetical protein [Bacteroides thetaiotaomicron]